MSSRVACLKGLAPEEKLVVCGAGGSILPGGFLGSAGEMLACINMLVCTSGHGIACSAQAT